MGIFTWHGLFKRSDVRELGMSGQCGWPHDVDAPHPYPTECLLVEDGLELRAPAEKDAEELFLQIDANRNYLREWLPWLDDVISLEDEVSAIGRDAKMRESGEGCMYLICLNEEIVGVMGLNWIDWSNRGCGIGYWISEDYTGQGIATRCCIRLMGHCFDDLGLHRLVLEAAAKNFPSRAIAERLGMRLWKGSPRTESGSTITSSMRLCTPLPRPSGESAIRIELARGPQLSNFPGAGTRADRPERVP